MITRIEIDGFKSFHNFEVDLRPFQVLIGPNGVGKSNLFDAIVLLSDLAADNTLYDAFRRNRGEVTELFTVLPNGSRSRIMRFGVEMLISKSVTDTLGIEAEVTSTRLRYELVIERRQEDGFERLYVTYESLTAIIEDNDGWFKPNIPVKKRRDWIVRGRRSPYISTQRQVINKHQDKRAGSKQETPIDRVERTVLSTINSAEYPTGYAVRQEMIGWRFLQFNPVGLRTPGGVYAPRELLPDGSNLATVLWRMSRDDQYALKDVSLDMANLVVGVSEISVEPLRERDEFLITAIMNDGSRFSSRVLSDGTLRVLALVALKNDPQHRGVLCFEEPENGVHPLRLEQIVKRVLKPLATDFESDDPEDSPPRQVLINTHSPKLLSCVEPKDLLFVFMSNQESRPTQVAHVTNQIFPYEDEVLHYYTLAQIREFLDASSLHEQLSFLESISAGKSN